MGSNGFDNQQFLLHLILFGPMRGSHQLVSVFPDELLSGGKEVGYFHPERGDSVIRDIVMEEAVDPGNGDDT